MPTKRSTRRPRTPSKDGRRTNAVHDVYRELRELIIKGTLAPGAPLIERRLAERLKVSRGSLRSALQRLEHEGFIQASSAGLYTRAVVTPLTVADMDDIYTLIAVLNGAAAGQAARMPLFDRSRIAEDMQRLNDQLDELLHSERDEYAVVYDLDQRFHRRYIDAAGTPRLRALCAAVDSQGERYGRAYASAFAPRRTTSVGEHQAIIDAIRTGDSEAAERAAVTNWRQAADRFRQVITSAGERGSF